jgi:pantoate--beta-alanine ligase
LSSRNAYLSEAERPVAPVLYRTLKTCAQGISAGSSVAKVLADGRKAIAAAGFALDYLEARNAETLAPLSKQGDEPIRLLVAARLGRTRLIDNIGV